ncbi:hypothetical protein BH10PSE17_BH10PSE17_00910 [soil metagenome]
MTPDDLDLLRLFAARYTSAWCSGNAMSVAACYSPSGSLVINEAAPCSGRNAIAEAVQGFMTSFPDLVVRMDDLYERHGEAVYEWTLEGTSTGPGGSGNRVRISGLEKWTMSPMRLIEQSIAFFDATDYQAQLGEAEAPGYIVIEYEVIDAAGYQAYLKDSKAVRDLVDSGTFLVRGAAGTSLSGEPPKTIAIIRFSSVEDAIAFDSSPEYAALKPGRDRALKWRSFVVPGLP